jgi:hypothetical protein
MHTCIEEYQTYNPVIFDVLFPTPYTQNLIDSVKQIVLRVGKHRRDLAQQMAFTKIFIYHNITSYNAIDWTNTVRLRVRQRKVRKIKGDVRYLCRGEITWKDNKRSVSVPAVVFRDLMEAQRLFYLDSPFKLRVTTARRKVSYSLNCKWHLALSTKTYIEHRAAPISYSKKKAHAAYPYLHPLQAELQFILDLVHFPSNVSEEKRKHLYKEIAAYARSRVR